MAEAQLPGSDSRVEESSPEKLLSIATDGISDGDVENNITEFINEVKRGDRDKTLQALQKMVELMTNDYFPEYLEERVPEISRLLEGIITRKQPGASLAAKIAAMMFVQCNEKSEYDTYRNIIHPVLISNFPHDAKNNILSDAEVYVNALGICGFVFATDKIITDICQPCIALAEVLYLRPDGNDRTSQTSSLCCTLLRSVGLLLVASTFKGLLPPKKWSWLRQFLEASNVDISVVAGEVVMLLDEVLGMDAQSQEFTELVMTCRKLATKGNKRIDRSNQRMQMKAFNNISNILAGQSSLYTELRFGSETLYIDTYSALVKYTMFRQLYTHGMHHQILENKFVREQLNHVGAYSKKAMKARYAERAKARKVKRQGERDAKAHDNAL